MSEETKQVGLVQKLANVYANVGNLKKDSKNKHQNYDYAGYDQVLAVVREQLGAEGVFLFCNMDSIAQTETKTSSGKPQTHTLAEFTFTFVDGATGETHSNKWYSEAEDFSDKSINKCATTAQKYFLMKTFMLAAIDDADPDGESPERGKPVKWYESQSFDRDKYLAYLTSNGLSPDAYASDEYITTFASKQELMDTLQQIIADRDAKLAWYEKPDTWEAFVQGVGHIDPDHSMDDWVEAGVFPDVLFFHAYDTPIKALNEARAMIEAHKTEQVKGKQAALAKQKAMPS